MTETNTWNLADRLSGQAQRRPDAIAVLHRDGAATFAELDRAVWRCATYLRGQGVSPGDVITQMLADELTLLVCLLASARIGAATLSLSANSPPLMLDEAVARTGSRFCLVDHAVAGERGGCATIRVDRRLILDAPIVIDESVRDPRPAAPFLVISGSGSTGRSKYFAVGHANFAHCIRFCTESLRITGADRYLSMMHLSYSSPKERGLATIFAGGALVLAGSMGADPRATIDRYGVSLLEATVAHVGKLLTLREAMPYDLAGLRVLLVTASTVSDALRRRIAAELSQALWIRYGTNETGLISICGPADGLAHAGSVGRVHAGVEVEIVRPDGTRAAVNEIGLVRVRSPGMIDAYIDDPDATRRAFRDGWFLPGDLARFDEHGQLIFCGRADQMMIFSGNNIYPSHIESVITSHPAVRDAAAFPLRHPDYQDVPACAVEVDPDHPVTAAALLDFCRQRMAHRGPVKVFLFDAIPRNGQGKLIRAELARRVSSMLAAEAGS